MTVGDVLNLIMSAKEVYTNNWAFSLFVLLSTLGIMEFSHLPFNPITAMVKVISTKLNQERDALLSSMVDEVTRLNGKMENVEHRVLLDKAEARRTRILRMGNEIKRGILPDDEMLAEGVADCDWYENYCNQHPEFVNNKAAANIAIIKKLYQQRLMGGLDIGH